MTESQFAARTPDPRLARQVPPRQAPQRPLPPRHVPSAQVPQRYGAPVDPRLAGSPSFRRTVGAEIARHAQQQSAYAGTPQRRTTAEDTALATLLRSRQRAESARQDTRNADCSAHGAPAQRQDSWMRPGAWPEHSCDGGRGDVIEQLSSRLVPPSLWAVVEPLIPPAKVRRQGGGRGRVCNRAVFTAIVFVLSSGCAWRHLPASFGVTVPTVHRRFQEWTDLGLWVRLRRAAMEGAAGTDEVDWIRAVLDAADRRAAKAAS